MRICELGHPQHREQNKPCSFSKTHCVKKVGDMLVGTLLTIEVLEFNSEKIKVCIKSNSEFILAELKSRMTANISKDELHSLVDAIYAEKRPNCCCTGETQREFCANETNETNCTQFIVVPKQ